MARTDLASNVATAPDYEAGIDGDLLIEVGAQFIF